MACKDSVLRIGELVESINSYSKSCSSTSTDELISLHEICHRAKILTNSETKNICDVKIISQAERAQIFANEGKITQVLINLIVNASHAFKKDRFKENEIVITIDGNDEYAYLLVKDNGSGIPKQIQSKIFDTFFTTKDKKTGTGLGLSLVKDIITKYKGTITFSSEEFIGTEFVITFPKGKME